MQDNVRVGKESLTKKISYHDHHNKKYSTINSLHKEPTRKTIIQCPPKHPHLSLNPPKPTPDRKLKSLTKHDSKKHPDRRWAEASHPELSTLDGLLKRNLHLGKFSVSKEREGGGCKQKYKRSEQIRSVIETKKMSSLNKMERKHTEATVSMTHFYNSVSSEASLPAPKNKTELKEPLLDSIINPHDNYEEQPTLQDVFLSACTLLYTYLIKKEASTSNGPTLQLKQRREASLLQLQAVQDKLRIIMQETGQMSLRTLTILGIVKHEQSKHYDSIMYLTKVLDATDGNLLLIHLPPSHTCAMQQDEKNTKNAKKSVQLNLLGYICLAESYKNTNNYLCSINALLKWQIYFFSSHPQEQPPATLKAHYQTLQPRDHDLDRDEFKQSQRLKKKSYLLGNLQNDSTINKLKKYSNLQNTSIEAMQPSKKNHPTVRPKIDLQDESICIRTTHNRENELSTEPNCEQQLYRKEITAIYLLLARLYVNIKSFESAVGYYKKCLGFTAHKIEAILQLASLYYAQKGCKVCLEWLQTSINSLQKEKDRDEKWQLDLGYLRYYKALILLQEGKQEESYKLFCELRVKQLSSEVHYYKGLILLKRLSRQSKERGFERNKAIQGILMHFNESISCFTSQQYLSKSFFQILVILLFEKKDYYGAQYELARFKKMVPNRNENHEQQHQLKSHIKIYEDEDVLEPKESRLVCGVQRESYFEILSELTEAVICILKMKIAKGLTIIKEIGVRLETEADELLKCFGGYYSQLVKVVLQFKFYAYYIQREYEMSLKHVNKLLEVMSREEFSNCEPERKAQREVETKLININRLMLECMILMKQTKFNYAMSKLKEIESMLSNSNSGMPEQQAINSSLIVNNFNMVKSLCYINIYSQLEQEKRDNAVCHEGSQLEVKTAVEKSGVQKGAVEKGGESNDDNNKQILLSAEELLRHCLISDKENSLIYYLIAVIHYELQSYESSLKYIRQALEYSDDHMIKHYFAKANTKALMGRYDEAIKDYTNAIIVFKEQNKNQGNQSQDLKSKPKLKEDQLDEYYQEKQIMIDEIYLNRAICYLKEAYALAKHPKYTENANAISTYRLKASEDLTKYFTNLLDSKIELNQEKFLRERLLLLMHTDDPHQVIEIGKKFVPRLNLLNQEDHISIYYLTKELNNCISNLQAAIHSIESKVQAREIEKLKKESVPNKYKKISVAFPKKNTQTTSNLAQRIPRLKLDLKCLQALKKSSSHSEGALEESLIQLLELTEQIYKQKEEELGTMQKEEQSTVTLQELLTTLCGQIFRWSDILFFIGVIHYQLREYQTAIKYFEESYNQKKMSRSLYSLGRYLQPREQASEQEQDEINQDIQPLFQNRVYSKQEIDYNLGLCYLMLKKYKQAYYYLQKYPRFLQIIRKGITEQNAGNAQNEFITQTRKPNTKQLLIEDQNSSQGLPSARLREKQARKKSQQKSISKFSDQFSEMSQRSRLSEQENQYPNITPFPIRNRLCSIYSPRTMEKCCFNLSFCLPKIGLPTLSLFHDEEVEVGRIVQDQDESMSEQSEVQKLKDGEEEETRYKLSRQNFESAVKHLSLLDLQMKPIAPWIRQNINGIVFTQNLINESVELNSERADKKKDKSADKNKKDKKDRYGSEQYKE